MVTSRPGSRESSSGCCSLSHRAATEWKEAGLNSLSLQQRHYCTLEDLKSIDIYKILYTYIEEKGRLSE